MKYTGGLLALIAAVSLAAAGEVSVSSDTASRGVVPDTLPPPRDTIPRPRPDSTRPPRDTVPPVGVRLRIGLDSLPFRLPTVRSLSERESFRLAQEQIAAARATAFQQNVRSIIESTWGQVQARTFATQVRGVAFPDELPPKPPAGVAERAATLLGDYTDLSVHLDGRVEFRAERAVNERCSAAGGFDPVIGCRTGFEPLFDFQASLRSGGVVANRIHVNVDYDSQREFDASNNISIYYQGREKDLVERFEIGNVTFQPPRSRFITAGIPSNNTGLQAITRLGPMRLKTIMAQQKGNIVGDRVFTVGDRTLQEVDRSIEDYQFEPRRFFFTMDPRLIRGYPSVDILDSRRLATAAAMLPDTLRPTRLFVYRLLIGAQPATPSGPQFRLLGDPASRRGQVYEYLREGIDYYADPSLLWIALVRPLSIDRERLVVAYRVRLNGRDTIHVTTGGTPDLEFAPDREQFANLVWDPQVAPGDPEFNREIRSVYRVGGAGIVRPSVSVKIVTGAGDDYERPFGGQSQTFLEAFGLAQETNSSTFDFENRLWPRPADPNLQVGFSTTPARMINDQFLVFPSARPFGSDGLATGGNPANDAIYSTPSEHLNTAQRPRALYHLRIRYQAEGGGDAGGLMLGSVQLRPSSERLYVDGILLTRGVDYSVDYDLGRVTFARPDTLFPRPRQVSVQYEENPLFADTPTSITGAAAEFVMERGQISFTAISQSQKTTFNRPPLGFEPAASLVAGVSGIFDFEADPLTRLVSRLPYGRTSVPSRVSVSGELAMSRPRPNAAGQAFIESFEGEGGIQVPLTDGTWYYSSQPALGTHLSVRAGSDVLSVDRAATMAWQSTGLDASGRPVQYTIRQIDPQTELFGAGVAGPETLLWMTLYPLSVGGLYNQERREFQWTAPVAATGRRWRSIRTVLGPSGVDLSRVENLEFWAQVDTSPEGRSRNPLLVFDLGDISENTLVFSPDTLRVVGGAAADSVYTGRKARGLDRLDSERDPFSRAFNVTSDDVGLPGDRPERLVLLEGAGNQSGVTLPTHALCIGGSRFSQLLGDARANCTVQNNRLDEEDIDSDNVLNLSQSEQGQERWRRYVVDLANPESYNRVGRCAPAPRTFNSVPGAAPVCWVLVRVAFRSPDDSLGETLLRRVRALRITMISGRGAAEDEFVRVPIARLRLTGAPWLKRDDRPIIGIGGETPAPSGYVIAGVIGTQDRNRTGGIDYESPPGVVDEPDTKTVALSSARVQINERSLRLTAGGVERYQRAEAYYRFPEGQKNFMGYKQLRLWARGINGGWGADGELHFYVKVGRDPNNFYMYRTPLNGGTTRAAWLPEIRVDFQKFFALRAQIQNAFLSGSKANTCTGLDSALIANTPAAPGVSSGGRYAACADGYIAYTVAPGSSAPNLASVQELAVGMVRVAEGGGSRPIIPGDTLELWVNDIRLGDVVDQMGFAGQFAASIVASDFGDIRLNFSRRDPHFRQLAEQPEFLTDNAVDISAAFRLEKLLPRSLGLAVPVTLNFTSVASDPLFLSQSDIQAEAVAGLRAPRSSAASYTVSVRRTVPLQGHFLAPLLNNLVLNSSYTSASARSEFQEGGARNFMLGADFNLTRALLPKLSRWSPAELYLSSVYRKGSDERFSFFRPASVRGEQPTPVSGRSHTWRNGAVLAFKPMETLRARFDLSSVRDLRDYDPTTALGIVAESEGQSLAGVDAGLERERAVQSAINFAPALRPWLRPRLDFASTYHMIRDPNTLFYTDRFTPDGGVRESRLPRRLANSQVLNSGMSLDLPGALAFLGDSSMWLRRAVRGLRPFELTLNRNMVSVFEGTAVDPPLSYQFAIGGPSRFLNVKGSPATSAAVTNHFSIGNSWQLPLGARLTSRYQQNTMRHWIRRLEGGSTTTDGTQVVFPDFGLQWSGRPRGLSWLWSNVGVSARAQETQQRFGTPDSLATATDDRSRSRFRSYPVTLALTWALVPGLSTNGGFSRVRRAEAKAGVDSRSRNTDYNVDVAMPFRLPAGEGKYRDVRTRFSYQSGGGSSFVINPLALNNTSRLFESGRRAVTLSADTDVGENLAASFLASRVASFDRNFNREITQTVLSAVLHLQFFGGEMK
ncbi:MAG TPA: cell surface protein SprA [Gemmatimonadaceae bacterium]|nr:cell surface protein SprA [Gemmatimonadaceae bacterium]